jgi:hypothetical protein
MSFEVHSLCAVIPFRQCIFRSCAPEAILNESEDAFSVEPMECVSDKQSSVRLKLCFVHYHGLIGLVDGSVNVAIADQ